MPKKSASRNKKRSTTRVRVFKAWCKEHSVGLFIAMSLGVIIVGTATTAWIQADHEVTQAKKGMATYLHDKYGKEFVVENYRIEGDTFGSEGEPTADAYPKDSHKLKFEIRDRGVYKAGQHAFYDEYTEALWTQEEIKLLDKSLKEIIGYLPSYSLEIHLSEDMKEIITFDEAARKYGKSINYSLHINSSEVFDRLDKKLFAGQYLQIMNLIKARGVSVVLSYSIAVSDKKAQYGISMGGEDFEKITNTEQIVKEFKSWRVL